MADQVAIAHLLKYDSIHRKSESKIELQDSVLKVNEQKLQLFGQSDPAKLPWGELDIDLVIECTGRFTDRIGAAKHLTAGAKRLSFLHLLLILQLKW